MSDEIWEIIDAPKNGDIFQIAQDNNTEELDLYFYRYEGDAQELYSEPEDGFQSFIEETVVTTVTQNQAPRRRSRSVGCRSHVYDHLYENYQASRQPTNDLQESVVTESEGSTTVGEDTFVSSLRKEAEKPKGERKLPRITKPQPFKLKEPARFQKGTNVHTSPTLAEAIERWNSAVPERFHTLGKNQKPPHQQAQTHRVTSARTPPLATLQRRRPAHYPGREVLEQRELEIIRKNGFKAHPIGKGVLTPPEPKEPKKVLQPTVPQTPNFSQAGKASLRAALGRNASASTSTVSECGSSTSMDSGAGERPRMTKVHPFSFEQRDKRMLQQKSEKIKKVIEEERKLAEFHANPVPVFLHQRPVNNQRRPQVQLPTTQLVPFQLSTEARVAEAEEKRRKKLEEESRENEAARFKAKPPAVLYREPFKPLPVEEKQLTQPVGFHLSSEERAVKRKEFDQYLKQRQEEIERVKQEREERKRLEEEEEAARLRRLAEFKAQPIHHYKPVEEVPRPEVTVPVTPKFARK